MMDPYDVSVNKFNEFAGEYAERFNDISAYLPCIDVFCNAMDMQKPEILELGCGPGNITRYLKQKFPDSQYTAVDLAPRMIEIARSQVKDVDFRVMDVRQITSLNSRYDAIMCSFCLPFLSKRDTERLITDCSSLIKKNGALYISTMEGDETMAGFEATSFSGNSELFFNYHRQSDLEHVLEENGFHVEHFTSQDYIEADGSHLVDMIFIARHI